MSCSLSTRRESEMSLEVHVLASGSDGNCYVIKFDDTAVMIDAGISFRKIKSLMDLNGLDDSCIDALLITHEHTDHTSGAGVTARKLGIPILCNRNTYNASNFGNVDFKEISMMNSFNISDITITALPTSHDAVEPSAYYFVADGKKILLATDTGKFTYPIEHALEEADIALVESNYDKKMLDYGPYPLNLKKLIDSDIGHMCNIATAEAIKRTMKNENRQVFLAHLSRHNNTPDLARETVSKISGIKRMNLDCLEFKGDTRIIKG